MIKLGIVGCGVIGQKHLEFAASSPYMKVTAVADIRQDVARSVAAKYGVEHYYASGDQLLEQADVDAVVLALLTHVRTEIAIKALEQGVHILLEKPPGMNRHEVERMLEIQNRATIAVCSSRFRCFPSAWAARQFIAEGGLGDIRTIRCSNLSAPRLPGGESPPWLYRKTINGGGVMADWGVYDLDYILGLLNWSASPEWVLGQTWEIPPPLAGSIHPDSDAETHAAAYIRCGNNMAIQFERGAFIPGPQRNVWEMTGTKGTLQLNMLPGDDKYIRFFAASAERGQEESVIWRGTESWSSVHGGPVLDFGEALATGAEPMTTLKQALVLQQVIDAIYESASTSQPVRITS